MPSIAENQERWTEHPWEREGHEWSPGQTAAGGAMLWWRGILPRIAAHLPAARILEIGPGFGRWTQFLLDHCESVAAVDVAPRCIDRCRERFGASGRFEAWVNDGATLDMIPDASLDFVFSFDSLVHAEAPVLEAYLQELGRKLRPGGSGFIHHSNLQAFADERGRWPAWLKRLNWRGETMSAARFREYCRSAGLRCRTQEVINWIGRSRAADRHRIDARGWPLTDVLSTFERPATGTASTTTVYLNPRFADEWRQFVVLARLYAACRAEDAERTPPRGSVLMRASRALERGGIDEVAKRLRERVTEKAADARALVGDHLNGWRVRRGEPLVRSVEHGRCPDCHQALGARNVCAACATEFIVQP